MSRINKFSEIYSPFLAHCKASNAREHVFPIPGSATIKDSMLF